MSKLTDELRDISAWHSSYDEDALADAVRTAADLLDEAEKALEAVARLDPQAHIRARATIARIRGEQP
jgi:hypothetical protein